MFMNSPFLLRFKAFIIDYIATSSFINSNDSLSTNTKDIPLNE